MAKFASISVPGGRRVARVALVSVLLAAAGSALGVDDSRPGGSKGGAAMSSHGGGAGNASGLSRMMSSATHSAGASRPAGGGGGHAMPSGGSRMISSGRSAAPAMAQSAGRAGVQVRSQPSSQPRQGAGMPPGYVQPQAQQVRSQPQGSSMLSPQRYSGGGQTQQSAPAQRSAPQQSAPQQVAPQASPSAPMQNMPMPGIRGTPQSAPQQASRSPFSRMAASSRPSGEVTSRGVSTPTLGAPTTGSVTPAGTGFTTNAGRPRGETTMFRTLFPARSSGGGSPAGGGGGGPVGGSSHHWDGGHGGWDGHGDNWHGGGWHGDNWHGGDWHHDGHWSHGHDDHFHGSFFIGFGWPYYYPYYYSSCWPYSYSLYYGSGWGSSWCWPYSSGYYPSYYSGYYNPVSYAMSYPTYAPMDYGGYGTTINNYYNTAPAGDPGVAMGAAAPSYVDNGAFKPAPPADDTATVYRSLANRGAMAWSDTATSIINAMVGAAADQRGAVAKNYLGRTPVGAWEATYEGRQDIENATELTCRGTGTTTTGGRPTIIVRVNHKVDALTPGQRLSVTGRLVEVSVDDSSNPGGVLVLEDANVSW